MLTRHVRDGVTWIDLESPSHEELDAVMAEFQIDHRIEDEIISPTPYPLVVVALSYVYLILHFPTNDPRGGSRNQEVDIIAGRNFLITVRYELVSTIHMLHRIFESEESLRVGKRKTSAADVLERLLRQLYAAITTQAEDAARALSRIEDDIFNGRERETVSKLSLVGRVLLKFDTAVSRHKEPLREFLHELSATRFYGKEFADRIPHIEAERAHAASVIASYRAVLAELQRTNDSLLSASQTEIVKRLTLLTFAAIPLTVIAGLFGMNTQSIPLVESDYAFWIIIGIMITAVAILLSYLKYKKWL